MKRSTKALIGSCIVALQNIINSAGVIVMGFVYAAYPDSNPLDVVTIITIPSLVGVVFSFIIGPLSLKFPKKPLILISLFLAAINGVILFFGVGVAPLWVLQIGAVLIGIMRGVTRTLLPAIITDNSEKEKHGTYLGFYQSAITAGGFLVSVGIAFLAAEVWQNAFLIYLIYIPIIIASFFFLPSDKPQTGEIEEVAATEPQAKPKENMWTSIKSLPVRVWIYSVFAGLVWVAYYCIVITYSDYIINEFALGGVFESTMANNIYMAVGFILGLVTGVIIKLLKKWTVPVCMLLVALANFLPFFNHSFISITLAYSLSMVGNVVCTYIWAKTVELVPKEKSGLAMSINTGFSNLGSYFCAVITVTVVGLVGFQVSSSTQLFAAGLISAVMVIIGFLIFVVMDKGRKTEPEAPETTA
ncbi:MAG: MFS transporter [Coriobacteriales bacterium]|jgi:MFS family permease|nr:MFS transporter [Coriobacteriales bacterium]